VKGVGGEGLSGFKVHPPYYVLSGSFAGGIMNKSELVEALSNEMDLTYKKSEEIVNIVFDSMSQALAEGGRIEIRGFGSFVVKDYKAYMGRNPKTGEVIRVRPKKLPFFKVGKELRERVNGLEP